MTYLEYEPPKILRNSLLMTIYAAKYASHNWEKKLGLPEPNYSEYIFIGAKNTPIHGIVAIPNKPRGTIIGTYGITGDLDNQWFLKILGRKAYANNYAVVLFDWRAHGKTAELSPALTSDGIYEGEDFVRIAAAAKSLGCPAPFWFTGYSLGGQLALWGVKAAENLATWGKDLQLDESEIKGGAVICPSLDSHRSLNYLERHKWGKYLEKSIAKNLRKLACNLSQTYPDKIDVTALKRVKTIRDFDREFVIKSLGFSSTKDYYQASSPIHILPQFTKSTFILYAADDPLFDPTIVPELAKICAENSALELMLTTYGGHVGYISSKACQNSTGDPDCWWAWNRVLEWCEQKSKQAINVVAPVP
ncbi:MAG: alpha/beta fold hydrolase [Oscillatoria sp. PMC 1068.18]|nr:alpha/beta fold hydrolase [Oscillatoria sp. PMC 1068.18]